jgi:hypothetical protein
MIATGRCHRVRGGSCVAWKDEPVGLRARRRLVGFVVAAGALVAIVMAVHPYPRSGADKIKHMVTWPDGCTSVTTERVWEFRYADSQAAIQCQMLGPRVDYAHFPSRESLGRQLRSDPPRPEYCVTRQELVTNGLDRGFPQLCARLHGQLVSRRKATTRS